GQGPDEKGGPPFLVILTETTGNRLPAMLTPVTNESGQLSGWLAGIVNSEIIRADSAIPPNNEPVSIYLSDREGNWAELSRTQTQKDITEQLRLLYSTPGVSSVRQIINNNAALISSSIDEGDWSVVTLRPITPFLKNFRGAYLEITLLLVTLSVLLMALAYYFIKKIMKPIDSFIEEISSRFTTGSIDRLDGLSTHIETLCSNMNIIESIPIGIMVVDTEGVIRLFNREAGEITGQKPFGVIGKSMLQYFPNNYYNYTIESIKEQREHLGLRNIIKVGNFFKELLFNISPIYTNKTIAGAVATFQDVTPQRKMIEVHAAYTLARDLASQKDLESTVKTIAKAAAEMVEIEYTAIFLADREDNLLIISSYGIEQRDIERYNSMPYKVDSPVIRDLYRNKAPLIHGDVRNKIDIKAMFIVPNVLSFYSFPVVYEEKIVGLVNLYSSEKQKLSKDKVYLIQTLSGQINTAIINFYEFQKMRLLASMDGLTGLLNKNYFMEAMDNEIISSTKTKAPLSLAILDLDHFKTVNDTYGHQVGDHVLKEVSDIMSRSLRETDSICRFGGEEIAIAMPGTPKETAVELIEKLRYSIENNPVYRSAEGPLYITVSGGVSTFPEDATNLEELILNSDTALYTAKRAGRNRVIVYDPSQKLNEGTD
ncbi:MAG: sensor domain-containing diguanylate cyclase, partial [Desulfocucumaceae bacterium]